MRWIAPIVLAFLTVPSLSRAGSDGDTLREGWERVIPISNPIFGEGDRYHVRVQKGWLWVERRNAQGETDWQVVLAEATDPRPPGVVSGNGSTHFGVSYQGGRYFVREDAWVLRTVRQRKPAPPKTWPAAPVPSKELKRGSGGPTLMDWRDETWHYAAAGPNADAADCWVRLAPTTADGVSVSVGFDGFKESSLCRVGNADVWVLDDGECLVATRSLKAMLDRRLRDGEPAPTFTAKTVAGKTVALGDFRGKYVLLDFWATWCGPCIEEFNQIRKVLGEYGGDGRLVVLGLSIDEDRDALTRFLAAKNTPWTQLALGPPGESPVAQSYFIETIPAVFLVGPDGTLIAQGLRGDSIKTAVERALKNRP